MSEKNLSLKVHSNNFSRFLGSFDGENCNKGNVYVHISFIVSTLNDQEHFTNRNYSCVH